MNPNLIDWDDAGILFLFFCSIAFVLGYSIRAPWWKHLVGRAMIILDITITLTLLPAALKLLFHASERSTLFLWYAPISCFVTGLAIIWRLWAVWHVNSARIIPPPRPESEDVVSESEESNGSVRTQ
jgi:hypothetical protein